MDHCLREVRTVTENLIAGVFFAVVAMFFTVPGVFFAVVSMFFTVADVFFAVTDVFVAVAGVFFVVTNVFIAVDCVLVCSWRLLMCLWKIITELFFAQAFCKSRSRSKHYIVASTVFDLPGT